MNSRINKKITITAVIAVAAVLFGAVLLDAFLSNEKSVSSNGFAMGSVVSVSLYGTDDKKITDEILSEISNVEKQYISKYKESSEIYRLNQSGKLKVSEKTADIIRLANEISRITDGAFDITIGAVSSLWDFDSDKQIIPEQEKIENALKSCGTEKLTVNGNEITLCPESSLDLGAIGKGVGCDTALDVIKKYPEITGAVVSVGGTVLTYGEHPETKTWTVGVKAPEKNDDSVFLKIKLSGTNFVSTSGNYEKSFEKDGTIYHHILSPENGYPAQSGIKSVTVIAKSGAEADALSTAVFVKGIKESTNTVSQTNANVIFIDNNNEVTASPEILSSITLSNGGEIKQYE